MKKLKCFYWSSSELKFEYNHDTTYLNAENYLFLYYSAVRHAWFAYTNIYDVRSDEFQRAFLKAEWNVYRYLETMKHKYDNADIDGLLYELETINRYV